MSETQASQGTVLKLYLSTTDKSLPRKEVKELSLDENGVLNDKFYAKDPQRLILLASQESYRIVASHAIDIEPGALGENILIDINPYHMLPGAKLQIGNILLEVTQNGTLCQGLSRVNSKLPKLLKNDRGIFFKVLNSGKIKIGDSVTIL